MAKMPRLRSREIPAALLPGMISSLVRTAHKPGSDVHCLSDAVNVFMQGPIFAELDPMKLLGPSAFGSLKFRAIASDGVAGDWQPLVNLVRMPELKGIRCPARASEEAQAADQVTPPDAGAALDGGAAPEKAASRAQACSLTGERLFLLDAVSPNPDFSDAIVVPDGFVESALPIPAVKTTLYLKLRDDPSTIETAELPVLPAQP